jgi:hypothetical protein
MGTDVLRGLQRKVLIMNQYEELCGNHQKMYEYKGRILCYCEFKKEAEQDWQEFISKPNDNEPNNLLV